MSLLVSGMAMVCTWPIAELYSAVFIAIKQPVLTGSFWPLCKALHNE
jgi:hypothetical protein